MAIALVSSLIKDEINLVKFETNKFIKVICAYAEENEVEIQQTDTDFYRVLAKHILFFKYILTAYPSSYFVQVIISDFYYYIISDLKNEARYSFLNERSIIENYLRMIIKNDDYNTHITHNTFEELINGPYVIDQIEYSLIKSEYTNSCGYIHGNQILKDQLSSLFEDCIKNDVKKSLQKRIAQQDLIVRLLKILDRLFIENNTDIISSSFHRRKSVLKYLLGESNMEILFK